MFPNSRKGDVDVFFFDIGRVLVDFLNPKFYEKIAFLAGLPASVVEKVDKEIIQELWPALETGELPFYGFFVKFRWEMSKLLPSEKRHEFSKKFTFTFFRDTTVGLLSLKRKVFEFVKFLKLCGFKIVFVSNNNSVHAYYQAILFPQLFAVADCCIFSHEVGVRKPDRNFWLIALDSVGVPADRVFVIDDLEENINSAKSLGMNGAVFTNVESLKSELEKFGFSFKK